MKYAWAWIAGQSIQTWAVSQLSPLVAKAYSATTAQEMAEAIIPMYFPVILFWASIVILISRRNLVKNWKRGEQAYRECIEYLKLQEGLGQVGAGRYMMM